MKFTVERDVLAEAVGWTARSLPLRPTSPVLNGLLITASAGEVSIASFDHETSARQVIAADVEAEGVCLVPARSWQKFAAPCRTHPSSSPQMSP